mmetsp:Transcript_14912/g.22689  ORF Transcript_14912/g.22689 Transcript_14912/m.22689 type:complete len:80 (+) Transcript_14912:370-609(+)
MFHIILVQVVEDGDLAQNVKKTDRDPSTMGKAVDFSCRLFMCALFFPPLERVSYTNILLHVPNQHQFLKSFAKRHRMAA